MAGEKAAAGVEIQLDKQNDEFRRKQEEKEIHKNKLEKLYYEIEAPLIYVLSDMEWSGVRLDLNALKDLSDLYSNELKEVEKEIISIQIPHKAKNC